MLKWGTLPSWVWPIVFIILIYIWLENDIFFETKWLNFKKDLAKQDIVDIFAVLFCLIMLLSLLNTVFGCHPTSDRGSNDWENVGDNDR